MPLIGIMGPHGAGKTTLCRALDNRIRTELHKSPVIVPDVARHRLQTGLGDGSIAQGDIIETQLRIEALFAQASDVVVFDNTSAGHLAYHRYWNGAEDDALRERVATSMRGFSAVLWLPPDPTYLIHDGLRPIDPAFQYDITERQRQILTELNIAFDVLENWPTWSDAEWNAALRRSSLTLSPEREEHRKQYVTAVGVIRRGDDVLFVKRHDERVRAADARWDLPGGRVEFGEAPELTVEREIFEETGYLVRCARPLRAVQSNRWRLSDNREEHALVLGFEASMVADEAFDVSADHGVADIRWASLSGMADEDLLPGIAAFVTESLAP